MAATRPPIAIILAAGKGTRMKSDLPKVAHPVAGRPMVAWVAAACAQAGCTRVIVVVGYQQEVVRSIFADWHAQPESQRCTLEFAIQDQQLGTGHAVQCAMPLLEREAESPGKPVFVLAGDGPLIRASTLEALLARHRQSGASVTIATSVIDDPTGYGRIVRDPAGRFAAIVEQKHATPEQLAIREVNPSYYCFDAHRLGRALPLVERNPQTQEYYITDIPALELAAGRVVEVLDAVPAADVLSINTMEQLAEVDAVLRARLAAAGHAQEGSSDVRDDRS
jgi:bifunctional UDP-N-acetylglucosamine pyrophosphorylase/glucosamine-1-phosphate N-acetyltransferase